MYNAVAGAPDGLTIAPYGGSMDHLRWDSAEHGGEEPVTARACIEPDMHDNVGVSFASARRRTRAGALGGSRDASEQASDATNNTTARHGGAHMYIKPLTQMPASDDDAMMDELHTVASSSSSSSASSDGSVSGGIV
jgi:hypothetical protein